MAEETKKLGETVPGGRYGTPGGGWVDADGKVLTEEKETSTVSSKAAAQAPEATSGNKK